jgi:hypothetical protein
MAGAAVFRVTVTLQLGLRVDGVVLAFALLFLVTGIVLIVRGHRRKERG